MIQRNPIKQAPPRRDYASCFRDAESADTVLESRDVTGGVEQFIFSKGRAIPKLFRRVETRIEEQQTQCND